MFNNLAAYIENTGHWNIYMFVLIFMILLAILIPLSMTLKKNKSKN
jgi:uncharacterized membrane protein YcgQ (UPF0703/DUF1980 family)